MKFLLFAPPDPMDAFRTLTGGSRFNRTRFAGDIGAFEVRLPFQFAAHFVQKNPVASSSAALPAELDFFGTAPAPSEKAVAKKNKKRRRVEEAARACLPAPVLR